ncbi:hypothetical protein RHSIM_Rhsim13G0110500 [Rhododendron simsii]|uniref:Poly [ADP-ribose] polymerase n=1 Tax=Rhododendron simsii TaxID=118357 RepID=A0A834G1V7_RHOSS|nr:hypothetical protein RHSIM_Rhsim13G0110500 [Rhododendron simsii]
MANRGASSRMTLLPCLNIFACYAHVHHTRYKTVCGLDAPQASRPSYPSHFEIDLLVDGPWPFYYTLQSHANTASSIVASCCKYISQIVSVVRRWGILTYSNKQPQNTASNITSHVFAYDGVEHLMICGGTYKCLRDGSPTSSKFSKPPSSTWPIGDAVRKGRTLSLMVSDMNMAISKMLTHHSCPQNNICFKHFIKHITSHFCQSLAIRDSVTCWLYRTQQANTGGGNKRSDFHVLCKYAWPLERSRNNNSELSQKMKDEINARSSCFLIASWKKPKHQKTSSHRSASQSSVSGLGLKLGGMFVGVKAKSTMTSKKMVMRKQKVERASQLRKCANQIFRYENLSFHCQFCVTCLGNDMNAKEISLMIMISLETLCPFNKGRAGDDIKRAQERLEEKEDDVDGSVKEFVKLFEELTGNKFEPWEREKKFQKKPRKFYPVDMDDGVDVRHRGLSFRQVGPAAVHCKLNPYVTSLMKVLCSQDTYRYAMMEMALDTPDLPLAMLTDVHLKRCEVVLLQFIETVRTMKEMGRKATAVWSDFSMKWFTLLQSTRPFIFHDYEDLAEHAAAVFESVRDMNVASRLIGDMSGPTLDDPLFDRYQKLGSLISPVDKRSEDYKMIVDYLERTFEPVKLGDISYGASVENILAVESSACPSFEEIKKQPNKVLLWCGTRSSNMLRHLHKGLLPALCWLPVPGYMFGKAIVCSDAAAEAARYGFTSVERPEGFLVLAIASLGERVTEFNRTPEAEEVKTLEEKAAGVKGLGRKKTDELEHFVWRDDIKVPRGRLVPSAHKDSPLEYNEYAVYDPKQVSIRFLVAVRYVEQNVGTVEECKCW